MIETEGKFLRQTNNYGYVARVLMEIFESDKNEIITNNVIGWDIEELDTSWIKAAKNGGEYALNKIFDKKYKVHIKKILGTLVDTNATIVGTATIFGIWNGLNIKISDIEIDRLTNKALQSWNEKTDDIPDYEK